jgi:hypothetical protein
LSRSVTNQDKTSETADNNPNQLHDKWRAKLKLMLARLAGKAQRRKIKVWRALSVVSVKGSRLEETDEETLTLCRRGW